MKRLSESERSEVWDRLEAGESVASVARRLGRARSSVRSHVPVGGVPPTGTGRGVVAVAAVVD